MSKLFLKHWQLFLCALLVLLSSSGQGVLAQDHSMPGMHKAVLARRKKKTVVRRKHSRKKHQITRMARMNMPRREASPSRAPQASPGRMQMNAPGKAMSEPGSSTSLHKMAMNMPGMQTPKPSPKPQVSPPEKREMNMPMPSASPGASPQKTMNMPMPSASPTSGSMGEMKNMSGTGPMNMGPLLLMRGDEMSIRVGSSQKNLMPMGQLASGTSWQPSTTPLHMIHKQSGAWLVMFHYNAVVGLNSQGGPRGVTKFESSNWFMPMAFRKAGPGTLQLRAMFSFEPFTFPRGGSPLLFQTGETFKGQPLIDHQHPHDLFMELSASYTVAVGDRATWFAYFGYPGEPALGPVAFMHRASAAENPSAPLSHHLQDSSHISFGVFTSGFTYRWFKLEGSVFNGREADENRYNFEAHPWNSRSFRVWFAPNKNWTMQISHGLLRNPEALEPGDVRRTTASVSYNKTLPRGNWAASLIWGRNHESHAAEVFHLNGYIAESTVSFLDKDYLYTRLELVDKNQLLRPADRLRLGIANEHQSFRIGAYTFGGARDIVAKEKLLMAIGSDVTFYSKPAALDPIYGVHPISWKLFLRLRPGKMNMQSIHGRP